MLKKMLLLAMAALLLLIAFVVNREALSGILVLVECALLMGGAVLWLRTKL